MIITFLCIFLLTAAISFAGSIHIGPVNLMVIRSALNNDFKSALWISIGGSVPEILYAGIALGFISYLNMHPEMLRYFEMAIVPAFALLGIYFLFKKNKDEGEIINASNGKSFVKGLLLATFNPQLLPFWFAMLIYLNSFTAINTISEKIAFITGTAAGAFCLLIIYAWVAFRKKEKINSILRNFHFDRILGITFILMAAIKLLIK